MKIKNDYTIYMRTINYINRVIQKRYFIIFIFIIIYFIFILIYIYNINIIQNKKYKELLEKEISKVYVSKIGERGKIYDRNGKLLVGNKEINIITYNKESDVTIEEELTYAKNIVNNIDLDYDKVEEIDLKKIYLIKYEDELEKKIDNSIKNKYKNREISKEEYINQLYEIITEKDILSLSEEDKKVGYVYKLMNEGYKYSKKIIKSEDVSDKEYEYIENNKDSLIGFEISIKYERYYPYGNTFRSYLGSIGAIPEEELEEKLKEGYNRNDIVGISYIEKQYEEYLKGTNETYIITANGEKKIISNASPGKDIILSIDINLQKDVEKIVLENVKKAKKQANTKYYNRSYVIISNPQNGEILAAVGKGIIEKNNKYEEIDYLTDLTTMSVTPGSIVKAASHLVGYENKAIKFGYTVNDSCIKIKNTPLKCSWKKLGKVDDLKALKYSSNYYQFLIAIKIGKGLYYYNSSLVLDPSAFKIYRDIYNQFGLGVKTEIDLPYESIGYIGNDKNTGSILDFPIGQYDTYTPMQLLQYINTVATTGKRIAPHFMKTIKGNNYIYEYEIKELNKVNIKEEYINRVKLGLKMVLESGGTGYGYINSKYKPSGKTGTAQSFIDTNLDGKIDTETITTTFGGYASYENPTFSIVVISPNISSGKTNFTSSINKRITRLVSDLYFKSYR